MNSVMFACPHHALQSRPALSALSHLLADYAITRAALSPIYE